MFSSFAHSTSPWNELSGRAVHQKQAIFANVSKSHILLPAQALECLKILNDQHFTSDVRQDLTRAIHAKVVGTKANGFKNTTGSWKQCCTSFEDIMPRFLWNTLLNNRSAYWEVVGSVSNHIEAIGLVYGSERTYVHITSLVFACRCKQAQGHTSIDVGDAMKFMSDLRDTVRKYWEAFKADKFSNFEHYPTSIDEFKIEFPDIYKDAFSDDVGSGHSPVLFSTSSLACRP